MTKVKICGINSDSAFDVAVEHGADYLGFVFFRRSPRFVTFAQAAALNARLEGGPKRVGLFVLPQPSDIEDALRAVKLDILQIYGDAALCRALGEQFGLKVWQAVGVTTVADLPDAAHGLDGFIIESKPLENTGRPGGNATPIDWRLTAGWRAPAPWLLAGGLTAENVAAAIAVSRAPGVDVSSGVESLPGVKSPVLIRRFIANARNAQPPARDAVCSGVSH